MYKMNKVGAMGSAGLLTVLMVFAIVAFVGTGYYVSQSVVGTSAQQQTTAQVVTATKAGDPATLRINVYDTEANAKSSVATGIYVYNKDKKILLADNTTSSATARTSVSANIGDNLELSGFTQGVGYYGEKLDWVVKSGNEQIDVPTHAQGGINVTMTDQHGTVLVAEGGFNMTLAASETQTWNSLELKNPKSNSLTRIGMIIYNFSSATNIDDVNMVGWTVSSYPNRMTGLARTFAFTPPASVDTELTQYEKFVTGAVAVRAKGTNPSEAGSILVLDKSLFKSVKPETRGQIADGIQSDAPTPTDVGIPDWAEIINIL